MAEFQIIAQPVIVRRDPASGHIEEGREIEFRDLRTMQIGYVFVPLKGYNPEAVGAAIREQVAAIRDVHNLSE